MSVLTEEQYNQLPDFVKTEYQAVDGGYQHGGFLKLKGTLNDVDSKYKTQAEEYGTLKERLDSIEREKQEAVEAAKREAYEKARQEGNVEEIEKRNQEMREDLERRTNETVAQYEERLQKLQNSIKTDRTKNIVNELMNEIKFTDSSRKILQKVIALQVDYDVDNDRPIFLDENGSATSLDMKGLAEAIRKDEAYKPFLQAGIVTEGTGLANGSGNGSTGAKLPKDYTEQERIQLLQTDPARFNQLFKN